MAGQKPSKKQQKAAKGAKPKDRRPRRMSKATYGLVKHTRSRKGGGNRRQALHADGIAGSAFVTLPTASGLLPPKLQGEAR